MGKQRHKNHNLRFFLVAAIFGALVSAYSNCSDINIHGHNANPSVTPSGGVQKGEYDACPKTNFYKTDSFFPRSSGGSTQEFGAMVDGATLVIKFTVPQNAAGSYGEIRGSSIDSGTQNRTYSISKTACDFSQEGAVSYVYMPDTKKQKTVWLWHQDWGLGDEVSFDFPIGNEGENVPIVRGQTYYLNIRGNYGCDNPYLGECPLTRWVSKF